MFRDAVYNDIDDIVEIDQRANEPSLSTRGLHQFWRKTLKKDEVRLETDECGRIRGVLHTNIQGNGVREIANLFTNPKDRYQGVASRLLKATLEDDQVTTLSVLGNKTGAIRLYQKFGFVATGGPNSLNMIEMERAPSL